MTVQTEHPSRSHEFEIDAGVVRDARARQHRHRGIAALVLVIAAVTGLLMFGGSGGSGHDQTSKGHGRPSGASPATHTASPVGTAVPYSPPTIGKAGLLSPGVGWAVNGLGFYMTWDGGRLWSDVRVPGLSGDAVAGFMAASSPSARTLVLAIGNSGSSYGTCADPGGSASRPIGELAISTDAGRSWSASPFPDCRVPTRISFINARIGFAVTESGKAVGPALLYGTIDAGQSWQRIGRMPKPGPIDFTSVRSGWLYGGNRIYRTSDGGMTWQLANVCRQPADRTVTLVCGPPHFFGAQGALQIIHAVAGVARSTSVSTTGNAGRSWTTHKIVVNQRQQGSIAASMSVASPQDFFAYFQGGLMARSTDGGRSWRQLPAPQFRGGTAIDFVTASYGWIQDGGSLYTTSDGGAHWYRLRQIGNRPPSP